MGRNKLLPKPDTTVASPVNFFSTSTGKGDKRLPALTPELNRGTSVRCGSSFVTPKYPVTCPVCHQSAGELRSEAGHGVRRRAATGHAARGAWRTPAPSPTGHVCPKFTAGSWLWHTATGFRGPGHSFIRPCTLHCLLKDTLNTSQYNLSHNIK